MAEGIAKLPSNRAAIYARVSTEDKGQTPDNQLLQLRAWCERMGYPVAREYVEHENGGKGIEYRKQLAAMFVGPRDASSTSCSYGRSTASAVKAWQPRWRICSA
jgi:hypothetical protein